MGVAKRTGEGGGGAGRRHRDVYALRLRRCSVAAGADAVLLIVAVLDDVALAELLAFAHDLGMDALVETHTEREIDRAVAAGARVIGVNCRDLRNFSTDVSLLESLVALVPAELTRIAESGMHSARDIAAAKRAGADGFLVGTALMRAPSPSAALKELISDAMP